MCGQPGKGDGMWPCTAAHRTAALMPRILQSACGIVLMETLMHVLLCLCICGPLCVWCWQCVHTLLRERGAGTGDAALIAGLQTVNWVPIVGQRRSDACICRLLVCCFACAGFKCLVARCLVASGCPQRQQHVVAASLAGSCLRRVRHC